MSDGALRTLLEDQDVTLVVVVATSVAREARALHRLQPVSASLLGQGLVAASLLAALQKGHARLNLQLECDGPLAGLFVDASADGGLRGYVKNPGLDVESQTSAFQWRPALGNRGFLSVLTELEGGEFYRSSVELQDFDLAKDLNHYFRTSNQVPTRVALAARAHGDERLGAVAGALVQALPGGDPARVEALGADLQERLAGLLASGAWSPAALAGALFPGHPLGAAAPVPLAWRCACSRERVLDMLGALPVEDLQHLLHTQGGAKVTCHFCGREHRADAGELQALLARPRA